MIESDSTLKKGDGGLISFAPRDIAVTRGMRQFDGLSTTISKVKLVKGTNTNGGFNRYYECAGVEAPTGIPYSFTRDMLISNEEVWLEN